MTNNEIQPNDVLCGRGGLTNSHIGNQHFRYVVAEYQIEYLHARKNEKKDIARKIVARIAECGGRFLKRRPDSAIWSEITNSKALLKTSQALREGLDVRQKAFRSERSFLGRNGSRSGEEMIRRKKLKSVEGFVTEPSERMMASSGEDVPDLVQDESPTQLFEPIFTFFNHDETNPETNCENATVQI